MCLLRERRWPFLYATSGPYDEVKIVHVMESSYNLRARGLCLRTRVHACACVCACHTVLRFSIQKSLAFVKRLATSSMCVAVTHEQDP